jgi:hypothetical protein
MQDLIVDSRFVSEDEMELRLAVRLSDRTLHVVGTKGDRLAFYDELGWDKVRLLRVKPNRLLPLQSPDADLSVFLASFPDEIYQRLVCQDPGDLGPIQTSRPVEAFTIVDPESL